MNKLFAALLVTLLGLPAVATAAIDETLRIKESVEINAPAEAVWAKVGNFGDMSWHPAIVKTEITNGNNNEVGANRTLTLPDGGTVKEVLTVRDEAGMTLKYEITDSVLPVREYGATLLVQSANGKTSVTWRSMFKRKDPANPGASGQDDKAAKEAITNIFKSGLENLKKSFEQ